MNLKVLIADDHRMVREGLRALLEADPRLTVVGEADHGRRAVELAAELRPDVVIMDVGMPELDGIEATRRILAEAPRVRVVILSMHAEKHFVAETLKAGARGYVLKDCAFDELDRALRAVESGQVYLSPSVAGCLVDHLRGGDGRPAGEGDAPLSPREHEVLRLLAQGKRAREVAELLHVSVKTVETHRQNLMKKLGVASQYELMKYAIREGLTSLDA